MRRMPKFESCTINTYTTLVLFILVYTYIMFMKIHVKLHGNNYNSRVKNQLFGCMKQTVEKCPGALELLALSGYDQEALRKGIDVLCHDVDGKLVTS